MPIAKVIIIEAPHQHNAARILITKQADCSVHTLLQIAEANDITKGFDAVQDPVSAAERLNQTVHLQVLVHP